jgi:signal transduction histidine kinase
MLQKNEHDQAKSEHTGEFEQLRRCNAVLQAIARGSTQLLKSSHLSADLADFVAMLGTAAEVDRVCIFENSLDPDGTMTALAREEWLRPGVETEGPQQPFSRSLSWSAELARWTTRLADDQLILGHAYEFPADEGAWLAAQGILTLLIAPIAVKDEWWGLISLESLCAERDWSPAEQNAIRMAAQIVDAALENARLQQDTQNWAGRLAMLHEISRTLGSTLDQERVLNLALERTCELFHAPCAIVYLADMPAGLARPHAARGRPASRQEQIPSLSLQTSLTGHVIITGRPIFIEHGLGSHTQFQSDDGVGGGPVERVQELRMLTPTFADPEAIEAAAFVPLVVGDHVLGTLNLGFHQSALSDDEKRLLTAVGRQVGIALVNARLFQEVKAAEKEARRRAEQLAALHEIHQAITSSLDPAAVHAHVVQHAAALLKCQSAHLFRWDDSSQQAHAVASYVADSVTTDDRDEGRVMTAQQSAVLGRLLETLEPVAICHADATHLALPELVAQTGGCGLLALPLTSRNQLTGFLYLVDRSGPRHWREDEIAVARQLAAQAAIAIENARLFQAEQWSRRTAQVLRETAQIINASADLEQVLDLLLDRLARLVPYDSTTVFLYQDGWLRAAAGRGFSNNDSIMQLLINPDDNPLLKKVLEMQRPVVLSDAQQVPDFEGWGETDYVRGWMGVPLLVSGELVGMLTIDSRKAGTYDHQSAGLALALADQAAVAIQKASLLDDLQRANRELRRLDDLKGQFIQNVAHELRTPLTLVRGYVELVAHGNLDRETEQEALKTALAHAETLVQLVEGITTLQDLSLEEFAIQPFHPRDLMTTALQLAAQKAIRAGVKFDAQCASDLPSLWGDFIWLSQAIYQLLDNAVKFSPNGCTVTLRISNESEGQCFRIEVEDQGIGVPPEERERIFDLFYQADGSTTRRFGGTGLGLAIVQRVVQAHHGQVWVESPVQTRSGDQSRGSRFVVLLPQRTD